MSLLGIALFLRAFPRQIKISLTPIERPPSRCCTRPLRALHFPDEIRRRPVQPWRTSHLPDEKRLYRMALA